MTGFGKDGRGAIVYEDASVAILTPAHGGGVVSDAYALTKDFRMLRAEIWPVITGLTAGDGIFLFGLCQGDLIWSEVQECLDAEPADPSDAEENERSHRAVWPIGILAPTPGGPTDHAIPSGVPTLEWTRRWTFSEGKGWRWWVRNLDSAPPVTGSVLRIFAKIFGVWVR